MIKTLIEWVGFALTLALALAVMSWWQTRDMLATDGDVQIPTLNLPQLNGGIGTIAPDLQRNTLIYFFAPWCSICRISMSNLSDVDTDRTRVVAIALDYDDANTVQRFVDDVGINQPVFLGNEQIRQLFKIKGYPSYYILGPDFFVLSRDMGYSSSTGLQLRVWQALQD